MKTGALLELFLDDCEPIKKCPDQLKGRRAKNLEMKKNDTGHYRLLVKKKV